MFQHGHQLSVPKVPLNQLQKKNSLIPQFQLQHGFMCCLFVLCQTSFEFEVDNFYSIMQP